MGPTPNARADYNRSCAGLNMHMVLLLKGVSVPWEEVSVFLICRPDRPTRKTEETAFVFLQGHPET